MKNLAVHRQRRRNLQFLNEAAKGDRDLSELSRLQCAVNPYNDDLFVLLDHQLYTLPIDGDRDVGIRSAACAISRVVGLEYSVTSQELYCVCSSGEIARINVTDESNFEYEVMVKFDDGLVCTRLSPDHEIVVAVTCAGTVITMVSDFQIISKVELNRSDFGEKQFITVGWGRKDTQFHGSEGKAAAKAKPKEASANESDSGLPCITWRGDGTFFAVSFLELSTKIRMFKVFNREGVLQCTSERTDGLGECLAWKPSGSLIAAIQMRYHGHVVALFEKNGLKHRDFALPFGPKEVTVKSLFWSPNSDVLAVTCEQLKTSNTILQLWSENNYHWYLKQTIVFSAADPLIYATWSVTGRYDRKELILLTLEEIIFCSFNWCVNCSRGKTANDKAVTAVIDGKRTLITSFRDGIIPPPMAQQSLETDEPVNAIVFAPSINDKKSWINSNIFCTVSCSNNVTFFEQVPDSLKVRYRVCGSCNIASDVPEIDRDKIYTMHHFLWLTEDTMLCSRTAEDQNFLCVLGLDDMNCKRNDCLTIKNAYTVDGPIEHIIPSPDADIAYVVANKSVLKYTKHMELDPTDVELKELCGQVEAVKIGAKHVIVALSCANRFLIDGKEVANNVTSFYVHSEFLLLTTLQHTLICVLLDENGLQQLSKHDLTIKPRKDGANEKSSMGVSIRQVERGSCLITAISRDSKTILQMPRGNLECIQPRAMSLRIIGYYLDSCIYLTAFDLMRRQRINLNLIYDHNPQLFAANAEKFVREIANPNWLSLFLSELLDADFSRTMYADCYPRRPSPSVSGDNEEENTGSKVERICGILRNIMEERHDADKLTQPILIATIRSRRCGLELALAKVKQLKAAENSRETARLRPLPMSSEDALKYLLYWVDINLLYDTALGMYDFELTMFVASQSQKDPKEYVPFLNNLRKMDENYMRYTIDMHLKRYESALKHLSGVPGRFEECLDLIRNRDLYTRAMGLFDEGSAEYKRVAGIFGEYFLDSRMYEEAAVMFLKSEDLGEALKAQVLTGNWQDAIATSAKMELSPTDLNALYKELVERLKIDRKYREAAEILKCYLNDAEEAVALLCVAKHWKRAIAITREIGRPDLHETHIIPGINDHAQDVIIQIHNLTKDFGKHMSRLSVVREEIGTRQAPSGTENAMWSEAPAGLASREVTDLLSEASSVAGSASSLQSQVSAISGRSYRSSKNRRKQERKLFSLKPGSMFEDLGLMHALHQIISTAYKCRGEWTELVETLSQFEFDVCAQNVQDNMRDLSELIQNGIPEIWNGSAPSSVNELRIMTLHNRPTQSQDIIKHLNLIKEHIMYPPPEPPECATNNL